MFLYLTRAHLIAVSLAVVVSCHGGEVGPTSTNDGSTGSTGDADTSTGMGSSTGTGTTSAGSTAGDDTSTQRLDDGGGGSPGALEGALHPG